MKQQNGMDGMGYKWIRSICVFHHRVAGGKRNGPLSSGIRLVWGVVLSRTVSLASLM